MSALSAQPKPATYGKWLLIATVAILCIFVGYWFFRPKPSSPNYLTAQAKIGDIENTVLASGKVKPINSVDVGSQVSGIITKLYVQVGDEVKQGDLIAQISQIEQKTRLPMLKPHSTKPMLVSLKPKVHYSIAKAMLKVPVLL